MAAPLLPPIPSTVPGARPRLRVIEGGRSDVALARRRLYRRRRIVAAVLVAVVAVVALRVAQVAGAALTGDGARTVTVGATPDAPPVAGAAVAPEPLPVAGAAPYVVRSGDTLWSIAAELGGDADVRELVDELSRRTGGRPLQPGQRIDTAGLPGLDG